MGKEDTAMLTGRLVFVIGDLFAGDVAKIYGTQNIKLNKAGQSYREYGFGLAVPKAAFSDPQWDANEFWTKLHQFVGSKYNNQIPPKFNMKYVDGDTGVNQDGTPVNTKEGYPGHMVFTFKTTLPPKFFKSEKQTINGKEETLYTQIPEGIKNGDWIRVQASFDINMGANCSVYLNPQAVELVGYGKEIINTPSGAQIFGARPAVMPPGASATPVGMQASPHQPGYPAPAQSAQPAPAVTPNWNVLPPVHQPQPVQQGPASVTFAQPAQAAPQAQGFPPLPTFPQPR